jgi:hypothetical protein
MLCLFGREAMLRFTRYLREAMLRFTRYLCRRFSEVQDKLCL